MIYTLYATGSLIDDEDRSNLAQSVPFLAQESAAHSRALAFDGELRNLKSAKSLRDLARLQYKLKSVGFDVYIERS